VVKKIKKGSHELDIAEKLFLYLLIRRRRIAAGGRYFDPG
jgi:hypothetical protein